MLSNNRIFRASCFVVLLLALQGCQDSSMSDLKTFVDEAYKDKKPEIEPLPEIQPFKGYEYSASEESDPFSIANIVSTRDGEGTSNNSRPDANRRREPLEDYPLDALKMVGTMTQNNKPWVIVQTSEGTAHLATVGNYLGQNDGKITKILTDEQLVTLAETVLDTAGRWITRDVEITVDE